MNRFRGMYYDEVNAKRMISDDVKRQVRDLCGTMSAEQIAKTVGLTKSRLLKLCQRQGFSLKMNKTEVA